MLAFSMVSSLREGERAAGRGEKALKLGVEPHQGDREPRHLLRGEERPDVGAGHLDSLGGENGARFPRRSAGSATETSSATSTVRVSMPSAAASSAPMSKFMTSPA